MLMLSRGLVVSMEQLLSGVGFDIRVSATQATPLTGPPITNMADTVAALAALPEIEDVVPLRIGDALVDIGKRSHDVTFMGADVGVRRSRSSGAESRRLRGGGRPWTLVEGRDLTIDDGRSTMDDRRSTILVNRNLARRLAAPTRLERHPPRRVHDELERASSRLSRKRHRRISIRSGSPADGHHRPQRLRANVRRRGAGRSRHADDRVATGRWSRSSG